MLSLSYLKASQASFAALYDGHPVTVIGTYMVIYILVTALSLPGTTVMTLSGILSPRLLVSFAVLGLLPITVKRLMEWYRIKKGKSQIILEHEEMPADLIS
jgi:hypothetical protein